MCVQKVLTLVCQLYFGWMPLVWGPGSPPPPPPSTLQLALHRFVWPIVAEPFLVIVPSFVSPLQSPSCSCTANISSSSLRKVTSNDPDVTLELKPALTGSAAPRGEAMFVSVLLLTLN